MTNKFSFEDRHRSEEIFHDSKYSNSKSGPAHYSFHPTYIIFKNMLEMMGDIEGKKVLEYGCGTGWITVELAKQRAMVDTFDISNAALEKTASFLKRLGYDNCTIRKMAGERLEYPDNYFDIVIGFAILHHLDLKKSLDELHRVLKPGGVAYFAEPLGENPFINLYRMLTPQHRTVDESPLVLKKILGDLRMFAAVEHREYYFLGIVPFVLSYIPWLKKSYSFFFKIFWKIDQFLLRKFPSIGRWAWYTVLSLRKSHRKI